MLESYFSAPWVLNRTRSGLMAPYLDTLAAGLAAQEYSRKSIRRQLRNADSFGWWLDHQRLPLAALSAAISIASIAPCVLAKQRDTRRTTLAVVRGSWICFRVRVFCRRPARPESFPTRGCVTSTNIWNASGAPRLALVPCICTKRAAFSRTFFQRATRTGRGSAPSMSSPTSRRARRSCSLPAAAIS